MGVLHAPSASPALCAVVLIALSLAFGLVEVTDMDSKVGSVTVKVNRPALSFGLNTSHFPSRGTASAPTTAAAAPVSTDEALRRMGLEPIMNENITDPWKRELYSRLDRVRVGCGDLCRLNNLIEIGRHTYKTNTLHDMVLVPGVDCPAILGMEEIDAGDMTFPDIPKELAPFFTLSGAYHIRCCNDKLLKQGYLEGNAAMSVWTKEEVDRMIGEAKNGTLSGSYGVPSTQKLRSQLGEKPDLLKGKSVLVIGSSHPWVEAICLSLGAKKVTTLEYGAIDSRHPQVLTEVPKTFRAKFLRGELEQFDGIVTHSSVEHSGLGRYGDALNPWGDILTIARAWCVTKDGGFMYLGVPTGNDMIHRNWHRSYGRVRWPLVTTNWRQMENVSNSDGQELTRGPWKNQDLGGWGYIFEKLDEGRIKEIMQNTNP